MSQSSPTPQSPSHRYYYHSFNNNDDGESMMHHANSNTLFVGNLPFSIRKEQLNELMGRYGKVRNIRVQLDRVSGKSLGFAFVELETRKDAENVFAKFNNYELNGRRLRLDWKRSINGNGSGGNGEWNKKSLFNEKSHLKEKRFNPYGNDKERVRQSYEKQLNNTFEMVKELFFDGKEQEALEAYFRDSSPFTACFLVTR